MLIRSAVKEDAGRLLEIYAYYVENTAISFEYHAPSLSEFENRILRTLQSYPYLVLEEDGVIQGYAYAGRLGERAAYLYSCEVSIYLAPDSRRKGYGRKLYEALESMLKDRGVQNMYARVVDPPEEDEYLTRNSEQFHQHLGFSKVGTLHKCGYKFGRWYNILWMEKLIGDHS